MRHVHLTGPGPALPVEAAEVAAEGAAWEATEAPAPAASACAMVTARAIAFAINAFDCLRNVAKGATRATANLRHAYTAVDLKSRRHP